MKKVNSEAKDSKFKWLGMGTAMMLKNLSYVFFIAFLGVVYIFNTHYAENHLRTNKKLERKITEKKWEYMSLKSEIMKESTRSEISKKIDGCEDLDNQKMPKKIEASKS